MEFARLESAWLPHKEQIYGDEVESASFDKLLLKAEEPALADPYSEFLNYLQLSSAAFGSWRNRLCRCLPTLSRSLADILNNHRDIGHFAFAPVTCAEITEAILNPPRFDVASFDRFRGPTKGDSRVLTPTSDGTFVEVKAPVDYSTWAAPIEQSGRPGTYIQKISASGGGILSPDDCQQVWRARRKRQADLFVNVYSRDLGITNWSSFFQYQRLHMRAIGYEMSGRLLWFNQMLNADMTQVIGSAPEQPGLIIKKDAFLVSVDFPLAEANKQYFCVYGLYINFDFDKGGASLAGPVFKMKNELISRGVAKMTQEPRPEQRMSTSNAAACGSTASLPDMNAQTYPFEVVQHLLDEAAYFPLFSIPDGNRSHILLAQEGSGVPLGYRSRSPCIAFRVTVDPPAKGGICVHNVVGERLATLDHRWMFAPEGFGARPGLEPPPTALDPERSQRFVMLDSVCRFENGKDGFRGFGTGRTYPMKIDGQPQLLAGAVGIIVEGFGKFRGLEGIYTYTGRILPDNGFSGSFLCRVMDCQSVLRTSRSLPELRAISHPVPDAVYLVFRGQKRNQHEKTSYVFGENGSLDGFELHPQIRILNIDCAIDDRGYLYSTSSIGPVIGTFSSYVLLNVLNPGAPGSPTAPISFKDYDDNVFTDREGTRIGSFGFDGGAGKRFGCAAPWPGEGHTFTLSLPAVPGQQALRFGGYAPIVNGQGIFKGIQGLVSDNSVVGVAPHAIATTYVARISDPEQKFRSVTSHNSRKAFVTCKQGDETECYKCEPCDK